MGPYDVNDPCPKALPPDPDAYDTALMGMRNGGTASGNQLPQATAVPAGGPREMIV